MRELKCTELYVCIYTDTHTYMYACTHISVIMAIVGYCYIYPTTRLVCACMYACVCVCVCVCVYIYIYIYMHTHTYVCIY